MRLATLIASRNRPDLVENLVANLRESTTIENDIIVVECGTDPDKLTPHSTLRYADPDFRGKCFGHNLALLLARLQGEHDFVWVLMNDLVLPTRPDPAGTLVETMIANPRMAILSPTNVESAYPGAESRGGSGWRPVTTCDYLGFMMRREAIDQVGFLNPDFRYCWGAIHELSYHLYRNDWFVAYSDAVSYRHLGGSTYGARDTKTISRDEYQTRAKRFAYDYFLATYGTRWDEQFWEEASRHPIEINTYSEHRRVWASAFTPEELADRPAFLAEQDIAPAPSTLRPQRGALEHV